MKKCRILENESSENKVKGNLDVGKAKEKEERIEAFPIVELKIMKST